MTPRERLDELEALLDDLRRANANTPILVEGANDRKALEQLGCTGRILLVHDGEPVGGVEEALAVLETHAVDVDERFREEMARLARSEAKTIEEMPSVLRRLRERVGRVK
jgi:5S rRNA maturation endonuclease (ribonuclease M5)